MTDDRTYGRDTLQTFRFHTAACIDPVSDRHFLQKDGCLWCSKKVKVKVKQSHYRPGVAQSVPGS